jgi:hypothetical protein
MRILLSLLFALGTASLAAAERAAAHVPVSAPRTLVLAGQEAAFRAYVTTGEGAAAFARLKADFDRWYLGQPFPAEPLTYGDPDPRARDAAKADAWRGAQDVCGRVSAIAEAAALLWRVTGEERYLSQAKAYLLGEAHWSLDARGWEAGPRAGGTDIFYNDEAHFRLWRKLPLVYDQLRDQFTAEERASLIRHYRERGRRSVDFIRRARTAELRYNSLEVTPSSHPVRFMPMTGLTALALWDDLPEAREWWAFAHRFYAEQFPPWGGDDGGWAEGVAYWRGVIEHAAFQDALLAIGDPAAYASPFWRQTAYFPVYHVQPYRHTQFGDLSNAGRFNLEPVVADFALHLARVLQDGHLVSYAALLTDQRPTPLDRGLEGLDRIYPTAAEFLIRNFLVSHRPLPAAAPLAELPPHRFFSDVGWVSMHSALGQPEDDIHATFISSPYGSFSHSHAHQNAFVLNAYGEDLALTGAYREWHNSPHHEGWTRLTKSKNAILIDGEGQKPKDKASVGRITRFDVSPRAVWTTGDATPAYALMQPKGRVRRVTRDFVFIDQRYVIVRDVVQLRDAARLTWALHAQRPIEWQAGPEATAIIRGERATLTTRLLTRGTGFAGGVQDRADVPVDENYVRGTATNYLTTGRWDEQSHLFADVAEKRTDHEVFAVLWPERKGLPARALTARLVEGGLVIDRPDGRTDHVTLTDERLELR